MVEGSLGDKGGSAGVSTVCVGYEEGGNENTPAAEGSEPVGAGVGIGRGGVRGAWGRWARGAGRVCGH
jgi:hypothetical protein